MKTFTFVSSVFRTDVQVVFLTCLIFSFLKISMYILPIIVVF